jgi:hypothetical protein
VVAERSPFPHPPVDQIDPLGGLPQKAYFCGIYGSCGRGKPLRKNLSGSLEIPVKILKIIVVNQENIQDMRRNVLEN